jgi:hypothetical protein
MTPNECAKLESFFKKMFKHQSMEVRRHPNKKQDGFAELYVDEQFIGTIERDSEDGDIWYQVQWAIPKEDLE